MQRELLNYLLNWQQNRLHLPLLLRGARQVGKTYLIEQFGKTNFDKFININFEMSPEYISCFSTLKPNEIINKIEIMYNQEIIPGKTLLFLDEIQNCTNAIMSLRYFKEQIPDLHIVGAGSLLEFALQQQGMKMPVGRVQYLYLKPVSFREYLTATNNKKLLQYISTVNFNNKLTDLIHDKALQLIKEYMAIGGMPMVLDNFLKKNSAKEAQNLQTALLKTYSDDFSKYSTTAQHKYLQQVYNKTPGLVGDQIKYVNISSELDSRSLKMAISNLNKAGVITSVYSTSANGLPLITHMQEKKFKLVFLDVGLMKRAANLDLEMLLTTDPILLNRGAIAEQFVGQELIAYQDPYAQPTLYYWSREQRGSSAEVDYLINIDNNIVPIEVKAGKTGNLKSLKIIMQEKNLPFGIRVSAKELSLQDNIVSIPFYMISEIPRLYKELMIQSA